MELTLISYNIRHGQGMDNIQDFNRIIDCLSETSADIIGLNEVDVYNPRSRFDNQPAKLASALNFHYAFIPNINWGPIKYGNCLLSKWPIKYTHLHLLPSEKEQRGCLEGLLQVKDKRIRVLVTHLGLSVDERQSQVRRIKNISSTSILPQLLMGDFNMNVSGTEFNGFYTDTSIANTNPQSLCTFPASAPADRIDHIFCTPHFHIQKHEVISTLCSDHLPVKSILKI